MKVAIINYEMGNVASVEKAVKFLGLTSIITNDPIEIQGSDFIILPGVGAFAQGMKNLIKMGLIDVLNNEVLVNKKPFLGICLGMQLLASKGFEPDETKGLNWIEGDVIKMKEPMLPIPHLGWNNISTHKNITLEQFDNKDFYFIHSYHFKVKNELEIAAVVNYGKEYVSIIKKNNILATQFHPEKSQSIGLEFLKMFFKEYVKN
jgi:glutamine amidotransferase